MANKKFEPAEDWSGREELLWATLKPMLTEKPEIPLYSALLLLDDCKKMLLQSTPIGKAPFGL
jgi:hypothetical protein